MSHKKQHLKLSRLWVGPLLFGGIALALVAGFLKAFAPARLPSHVPPFQGYDNATMDASLQPGIVQQDMETIIALGPRFQGLPGFYMAREWMRRAFDDAGLQVLEYSQKSPAPRTLWREICNAAGAPLSDVEIFPFMPNQFQPIVTPEAGLTGTLLLMTDEVLQSRTTFTDCIALIDVEDPPELYGLAWTSYAQAGFKAVILAHREGLDAIRWESVGSVRGSAPVNYTRLAASANIFNHIDEQITLRVKVIWEEIEDSTLVGILPSTQPSDEAVVISAAVDACSVLPDRSPGTLGALNIAAQLAVLKGTLAYRDDPNRKRDLVFVSYSSQYMAQEAVDALTTLIGPATDRDSALTRMEQERAEDKIQGLRIQACSALLGNSRFLDDADVTDALLKATDKTVRDVFEETFRYVLNTRVLALSEVQLQARLAFQRVDSDTATPAFTHYLDARAAYDEAMSVAGLPLQKILSETAPRAFADREDIRGHLAERLMELTTFHAWKTKQLDQAVALHQALRQYKRLIAVSPFLAPADPAKTRGETFSFCMGPGVESQVLKQSPVINDILQSVMVQGQFGADIRYEPMRARDHSSWAFTLINQIPVDAAHWNAKEYPGFVLINTDRSYAYGKFGSPVDDPAMHMLGSVSQSLRVLGRTVLTLAYGYGTFEKPLHNEQTLTYSGRIYLSNVGRSIVPNYPLKHALIGHKGPTSAFGHPGFNVYPFFFADPYGRYYVPQSSLRVEPYGTGGYSPEVVAFGEDGLIRFVKDEGAQGQRVYKSINVGRQGHRENINIVAFRASPVTLFDLINPQNLKSYTGCSFIRSEGLTDVNKLNIYGISDGLVTAFLEPDCQFYVKLNSGSVDNERVQTTRAFLLGSKEGFEPDPGREIDGPGYLVADTPFLLDIPREVARSMLSVNGKRLALQQHYHMADKRAVSFHQRSEDLLSRSLLQDQPKQIAEHEQRAAVTYATLNHPVIRRGIFEAVAGILWYLGLLVPFVFFFEKLAFGFSDIRKQIGAQTVIFLIVFLLLRGLHPAFAMIRSSLMILLGFVIMLIAGGMTILCSGKFKENFEELSKRRGQVSAAEINTMGVLGTAFALGLNNMHRRIVRTGLTCATLVLLTFAMICFTSVQSDVVDTATAIGKASYQGLLIKPERFKPITEAEHSALRSRYQYKYKLAARSMILGRQGWDKINYNPALEAVFEPANDLPKRKTVSSIVEFSPDEPLRDKIRLLTNTGWFTKEMLKAEVDVPPVFIPETLATALNIRTAEVEAGTVKIKINGKLVRVHGIFDPQSLSELRDLDGRDMLPFDLEAMRSIQILNGSALADDKDTRLSAESIVIAPGNLGVNIGQGERRLVSVAVCMPALGYKPAKVEIDQYLEQSGQATYYGLAGITYFGKRAREKSFAGLLELLIPLMIASMTVLNTMRGSVYERRDEIFVYNAVGIAPRYIFVMFFSEAFVFSVVGSVLGYVISQGLGKALTTFGWTGGLNMTFTSLNTIYASLAIMVSVFVSTLFPARSAMKIAAPADDSGWTLPEPENDIMAFNLPFTFGARDRIAVLAFFNRFFVDHGEGSAGRFFAAVPALGVLTAESQAPDQERCVPRLASTIWLKPFDLGVSQELQIIMPRDPETGEYIARVVLNRLSGTRESWMRLNEPFVVLLRQHFLYWRAVSPDERKEMFTEARSLIETAGVIGEVHGRT